VSRSAYYGWYSGQSHQVSDSDKKLAESVTEVFQVHRSRYGSRRIMYELRKRDLFVSRKTVSKTMQKLDLKAIQPRSFVPRTTDSRHSYHVNENLLLHSGPANSPNRIWVGDITYIPMAGGGWSFLSTWMDLYSRRIVGWELADHMKETLVIESFKRARRRRSVPKGLIVHTDRGGQYAGKSFRMLLGEDVRQSMSRADDPYDNAFMESFYSRFKAEMLGDGRFLTIEDARTEIFEFIEMYYNTIRIHSSLSYQSPMEYEEEYHRNASKKAVT
jgi:transposase InsO family protein